MNNMLNYWCISYLWK